MVMVAYNAGQGDEYYQMPILSDVEWDNLLSNVSVLSFMQGLPCGLKTYNNYAIVTSTNNELMTNFNDIYYIPIVGAGDGVKTSEKEPGAGEVLDTAHHLDCMDSDWLDNIGSASYFQSFSSKDAKYDKEYVSTKGKFVYDHLANNCYYCIIDNNYDGDLRYLIDYYKQNNGNDMDKLVEPYKTLCDNIGGSGTIEKLVQAEMIAVAKIKNNTYKSIASLKNYGVYTQTDSQIDVTEKSLIKNGGLDSSGSRLTIPKGCYSIEVTLDVRKNNEATESAKLVCGGVSGNIISSSNIQKFVFDVDNFGGSKVLITPDKTYQIVYYNYVDSDGVTKTASKKVNIYDVLAFKSVIYYYK